MKFRLKITICTVWLLALALGLGGGLLICQSFAASMERERTSAVASYQMMVNTLQMVNAGSIQKDDATLSAAMEQLSGRQTWAAARLRSDAQTVFSTGRVVSRLVDVQTDADHCVSQDFTADGRHYLQVSGQITANAGGALRLDTAYDVTAAYDVRTQQLSAYSWIFLVTILIAAVASWAGAYLLTRPLGKLSGATRAIADGRLEYRVRLHSGDEMERLGQDFNLMACQLEQNVRQLQQSMERQEQFMGSFAHELKTPMTAIIGYADLLRTGALTEAEAMDAANYIFSEGKRLEALSLKLLDLLLMKNQALVLQPTQPEQMIGALVRHLRPVYEAAGIRIQYRCQPGTIRLEPDLVKSLLINLLDNARKALEQGGNIYLVSDWVGRDLRIRVLDNGRGMPREALEHLTEAFYRVDKSRSRQQGGAGLGLTLCQRIVALHGGTMTFTSREGNGTCVTVILKGEPPCT